MSPRSLLSRAWQRPAAYSASSWQGGGGRIHPSSLVCPHPARSRVQAPLSSASLRRRCAPRPRGVSLRSSCPPLSAPHCRSRMPGMLCVCVRANCQLPHHGGVFNCNQFSPTAIVKHRSALYTNPAPDQAVRAALAACAYMGHRLSMHCHLCLCPTPLLLPAALFPCPS